MAKKPKIMLKNYTTIVNAQKTISEIEEYLVQIGASKILKDYDDKGEVLSISFMINFEEREVPIRLPSRIDRIPAAIRRIYNTHDITSGQRTLLNRAMKDSEQARRIGWRIIKDWLEAQMTIMMLDQINMMEALLPFTVWKGNKTMYELIEESGFNMNKMAQNLLGYDEK